MGKKQESFKRRNNMSPLIANNEGGSGLEPIPAGMHVARCTGVIDLGTHENKMFNKWARQIYIQFEIPGERNIGEKDGESWDKPRFTGNYYTLSLHEKSNLYGHLISWRGRAFTDEELAGFDLSKLIGVPCTLNMIHQRKKTGIDIFAKIQGISPLMKGTEAPAQESESVYFSFDDAEDVKDIVIPENLPQWLIDKILDSEEWKAGGVVTPPEQPQEPPPISDDDIPF